MGYQPVHTIDIDSPPPHHKQTAPKRRILLLCLAPFFLVLAIFRRARSSSGNDRLLHLSTSPVHIRPAGDLIRHFGPFTFPDAVLVEEIVPVIEDVSFAHHIAVKHHSGGKCQSGDFAWHGGGAHGVSIYSWSKGASSEQGHPARLAFEQGTGFPVGQGNGCLFVEVHFSTHTRSRERVFKAQFDLGVSESQGKHTLAVATLDTPKFIAPLPPGQADAPVCVRCIVKQEMNVVAARVHAHSAGRTIESVVTRNGTVVARHFASRSAELAQTVFPFDGRLETGDVVVLHCHYNTTGRLEDTPVGPSPVKQEMCNQYLVYYPPPPVGEDWGACRVHACT